MKPRSRLRFGQRSRTSRQSDPLHPDEVVAVGQTRHANEMSQDLGNGGRNVMGSFYDQLVLPPSILKSRRPLGADSPRAQKCIQFSDIVEFATRGWWHADAEGDRGVTLMKECGTEGLNGDGPLSFQNVVKDEVPEYESLATSQARFVSKV